jgi:hypothetical protein
MDTAEMELATAHQDGRVTTAQSEHVLLIVLVMVCVTTEHATALMDGEELIAHNVLFVQMIARDMVAARTSHVHVMKVGWEMIAH